jgi:purine-cytosine permease-like protein
MKLQWQGPPKQAAARRADAVLAISSILGLFFFFYHSCCGPQMTTGEIYTQRQQEKMGRQRLARD